MRFGFPQDSGSGFRSLGQSLLKKWLLNLELIRPEYTYSDIDPSLSVNPEAVFLC